MLFLLGNILRGDISSCWCSSDVTFRLRCFCVCAQFEKCAKPRVHFASSPALRSVFGCQLAAAPLPAGSSKTLSINRIETDERAILMEIDHPNIVKLEGVYYESEDCIYLVQELCSGGDLFDRLDAQPEEHYSEAQCARLVKQMLSAVRSIAQRDLKLEFFCV